LSSARSQQEEVAIQTTDFGLNGVDVGVGITKKNVFG